MKEKVVKWIKAAGVRAIKTVAQAAVATIGTAAFVGEVNWVLVGSTAALAGIPFVYCAYGFGQVKQYWKKIDSFKELLEKDMSF